MANPKPKKRRKIIVFTVILLALAGLTTAALLRRKEVVITVQTDKVVRRNITELVAANGRIQPVVQVVINPEVSGEIIALPVKEGQMVKKGDLLVKIKPDNYIAQRNSAEANYQSALASVALAQANLDKATLDYARQDQLFKTHLISDSQFLEAKTSLDVMKASFDSSGHQAEQAKAARARSEDDLSKTTISAPMDGTVTKLRSQLGERVVGTAMMAGTEIMTIAELNNMEARVDIGEIDIPLIALGQKARLEIEAFRDRKFNGTVTEIANASKGLLSGAAAAAQSSQNQEATKFEVKILIGEKEILRPGMSVTAEIETRSRTNVLTLPIQSVTTRLPKGKTNHLAKAEANAPETGRAKSEKSNKQNEGPKPREVVFALEGDHAKMLPVKIGISDDSNIEVIEGVTENQEIIIGGYKALSRDLEDGKKVKVGPPPGESPDKKP
ncbi:MAG: Efflux transporter, family, subunit [Verrucomicrobiales bacterium]|nr:Efflux transporter, family, subunit [Verrucomicrobiales bacterium]